MIKISIFWSSSLSNIYLRFAIAAILNWDKGFVINKIKENTNGIIDLNILSGLTVVLFILGSAIIIVSVIGLVGACCASKCFLIFYEIILAVLFVFHLIILIYFLVKEQEILDKINSNLNKEVVSWGKESKKNTNSLV